MNIGVFFGSRSTEHDISIITAQFVIATLKKMDYNVIPVYLSKKGDWLIGDDYGKLATFTDPKNVKMLESKSGFYLDMEKSFGKLVFKKKGISGKEITVDLAFPAFHGAYGEDGTVQGLFEILNIPYIGCDVTASALSMDKALTKQMCEINDIPTTKFKTFYNKDWEEKKEAIAAEIRKDLKWPVFIKPVHLGSSIGISKVSEKDTTDLEEKIEVGLFYDDKILVEEGVQNLMDVTCCVIGNEDPIPSLLQESVFQADMFNFEEKYLKDGGGQLGNAEASIVIPARLDEKTTKEIQETAMSVYKALGCSGIARVDFLYDKETKEYYANEINPLPGTLYHHLWKASGIEINELIQKLIDYAEEKYAKKQQIKYTFNSSVLESLGSSKLKFKK